VNGHAVPGPSGYRSEEDPVDTSVLAAHDHAFRTAIDRSRASSPRVAVAHVAGGRTRLRLREPAEAPAIARALAAVAGVHATTARAASGSVIVRFDPHVTSPDELARSACALPAAPASPAPARGGGAWSLALFNTAVLAVTAADALARPAAVALVALTAGPSAGRATRALSRGRLTVDVLDVAAIALSLATGRPATAAFVTWLLGLGDLVLQRTSDRARDALSGVLALDVPDASRLASDGRLERVAAATLAPRDRIVVAAGEAVAADGVIVEGTAMLDEKALTGESLPKEHGPGDRVLASTVASEGQIVVEVERAGVDTTAARILQILRQAGAKPMTLQREVEDRANRLVAPTIVLAIVSAWLSGEPDRMTSVLITDFGTGIRIAAPTSALTAMTLAAREGILVKGAQYLERLAHADTIVFDKTGTLTTGEPEIIDVRPLNGLRRRQLLGFIAAAEAGQQHPLAVAVLRCLEREGIDLAPPRAVTQEYVVGKGLRAVTEDHEVLVGGGRWMLERGVDLRDAAPVRQRLVDGGASCMYAAVDGRLEAVIGYADEPRPESAGVVAALRAGGRRRVVLMSGDTRSTAEAIGARLGVDEVMAELLPQDKATQIEALRASGRTVAMVGDGINDAPALALADVGVSLRGGTDAALEAADVVLLDGGLEKLPRVLELADFAMRSVHRGIATILAPNAVAIVLAAFGVLSPGVAATINNGSTVAAAVAAVAPLATRRPRRPRGHAGAASGRPRGTA
jgi:Cu2+-exporting ATPase